MQLRISPFNEDVDLVDVPIKGPNMWQGATNRPFCNLFLGCWWRQNGVIGWHSSLLLGGSPIVTSLTSRISRVPMPSIPKPTISIHAGGGVRGNDGALYFIPRNSDQCCFKPIREAHEIMNHSFRQI